MANGATAKRSDISPLTLGLAAAGSVAATVAVARFGLAGSLVGAALAPVIVSLVKELGRKPLEGAASIGAAARRAGDGADRRRAGTPGPGRRPGDPAPITIHRTPRSLRRVRWGAVAVTSTVAFAVAIAAFTVPDLLNGSSIVSGRDTTFFDQRDPGPSEPASAPADDAEEPAPDETETTTETDTQTVTVPEEAPTTTEPAPEGPVTPDAAPEGAPPAPAPAPSLPPVTPAP